MFLSVQQKGWLCCKSSCHICPALHRRAGPLAPRDNHSLAEGHLFSLVSVGGTGRALVAFLGRGAARHGNILAPCSLLLYLLIFSCDACLVAVMLLAWVLNTHLTHIFACSVCRGGVALPMQTGVRRRGFCRAMASCHCHPRLVSYSCGGAVCYLLMPRTCSPLSYFSPCCAC